jgi:hypothetical protein
MTIKQILATVLFLVVLIAISVVSKNIILNGVPQTKLQVAPPLAGTLSQSLITYKSKDVLPVIGKDFTIQSTQYFNNQQWAVVLVSSVPDNNNAILVLEKLNGNYQVVLGPGTSFSTTDIQTMPSNVISYLTSKGLVSSATFSQ